MNWVGSLKTVNVGLVKSTTGPVRDTQMVLP